MCAYVYICIYYIYIYIYIYLDHYLYMNICKISGVKVPQNSVRKKLMKF